MPDAFLFLSAMLAVSVWLRVRWRC